MKKTITILILFLLLFSSVQAVSDGDSNMSFFEKIINGFRSAFTVAPGQTTNFAGFNWLITGEGQLRKCLTADEKGCAGSDGKQLLEDDFLILKSESGSGEYKGAGNPLSNIDTCAITQRDISDIDEFLIIFEGNGRADVGNLGKSAESKIEISLINDKGQFFSFFRKGCSGGRNTNCDWTLDPIVIKLMNNFDGTYSLFSSLGVGDIFVKEQDFDLSDSNIVNLRLCSKTSAESRASAQSQLKIYNVVTKEFEASQCKANQVIRTNGTCEDLEFIILSREEALFQSLQERIEEKEKRLQDKQIFLESEIERLNLIETTRKAEIDELQRELVISNALLKNIEEGQLTPPPDVGVEEVINEVLDRIEDKKLSEDEINIIIDDTVGDLDEERAVGLQRCGIICELKALFLEILLIFR